MGKDRKGVQRGVCSHPGCECDDYELPAEGHPCAYCGHYPAEHRSHTGASSPRQMPAPPAAASADARAAAIPTRPTTTVSSATSASPADPFFSFASRGDGKTSSPPGIGASSSSFSSYSASTTSFARPTTAPPTSATLHQHHYQQQRSASPPSGTSAPSPSISTSAAYGSPTYHQAEVQTAFSTSGKRSKPKESLPMQLWNNPQEVVKDVKLKVKQKTKKHQA